MNLIDLFNFGQYFKKNGDGNRAKIGHVNAVIEELTALQDTVDNLDDTYILSGIIYYTDPMDENSEVLVINKNTLPPNQYGPVNNIVLAKQFNGLYMIHNNPQTSLFLLKNKTVASITASYNNINNIPYKQVNINVDPTNSTNSIRISLLDENGGFVSGAPGNGYSTTIFFEIKIYK